MKIIHFEEVEEKKYFPFTESPFYIIIRIIYLYSQNA